MCDTDSRRLGTQHQAVHALGTALIFLQDQSAMLIQGSLNMRTGLWFSVTSVGMVVGCMGWVGGGH